MLRLLAFILCLGFATQSCAGEVGEPVTIPVSATVSSIVMCTETGNCGDAETIVIADDGK